MKFHVSALIWLGENIVFKIIINFLSCSYIEGKPVPGLEECPDYLVGNLEQRQQQWAVLVVMSGQTKQVLNLVIPLEEIVIVCNSQKRVLEGNVRLKSFGVFSFRDKLLFRR